MTAPLTRAEMTPMVFADRTVPCSTCNGSRVVVEGVRYSGEPYGELAEFPCDDCTDGTEPLACNGCDRDVPLADNGQCADCNGLVEVEYLSRGGVAL